MDPSGRVFQTDPCGVEASGHRLSSQDVSRFQTDPCGVEATPSRPRGHGPARFQTDPCGVEATTVACSWSAYRTVSDGPLWGRSSIEMSDHLRRLEFQTDPCGVEATPTPTRPNARRCFRRTLVGSKRRVIAFRRGSFTVSDGPLWGRSYRYVVESRREVFVSDGPLWGRSSVARSSVQRSDRVSDGPLWGRSPISCPQTVQLTVFQTDPCGIEAIGSTCKTAGMSIVSDGPL